MKKFSILICCCLILQLLCACSGNKDDFQAPVNFYFCKKEVSYNSTSAVIQAETREGISYNGNLAALLRAYLLGPHSQELNSLIPSDVYLVSCEISGDAVIVVFSSHLAKLSGIDLSTACSALLMTVRDYTGVETLRISAKDSQLEDKDELVLTYDEIVLMDTTVEMN